jgi:membrane protein
MAVWSLLRETASRFSGHKSSLLDVALAYYAVFSLGPLMVLAIAAFVFGDEAPRGEVSAQLKSLLGDTGARAVEAMLAGDDRHHNGLVSDDRGRHVAVRCDLGCSLRSGLFAAIWIVVALKETLNTIWDVVAVLRRSYPRKLVTAWRVEAAYRGGVSD